MQTGRLGERCQLPSGVSGKASADRRFEAYLC